MSDFFNHSYGSPLVPDDAISDQVSAAYIVTAPPESLPVELRDLKEHLRLPLNITTEDMYLTGLIEAARDFAENYMRRVLITTGVRTFRDCFHRCITIKRSPFQIVTSISYYLDGELVELAPTDYYEVLSTRYANIYPDTGTTFPTNIDDRKQAVLIDFVAGYGDSPKDIPAAIRAGLLEHAAKLYADRGDCSLATSSRGVHDFLPSMVRGIYDRYRIRSLIGREAC